MSKEQLLFKRFHTSRDPRLRSELTEKFLPLAHQLALRYARSSESIDDLAQVSALGLLKAIDRFDPWRGTAFSSFAVPTILGEIKRHFRDNGWSVRVPRDLQELALKVERVGNDIGRELGRQPTTSEIACAIGHSPEQVIEAREALAVAYRTMSLDHSTSDEDDSSATIADVLGDEDPGFASAEAAATLERLLRRLDARDRELLALRFRDDLTQSEIGDKLGISQMHVSRLIRQSIARLRDGAM